ncbi:hypothetical protein BSPWISOXPB_7715 [uncultured Gammaproteobacteria bacterium]|jgi:hypothetical protein|nr:hypothetical protein BSPWISOXPB_7715 [uncultured Gammaproteobacteria bacterium]
MSYAKVSWHCFVGEKNDYYTLLIVFLFFEFGINGCLCLEFEKMAGNSHYFFVLAKTGFIFCKIPKVFCGTG